MFSCMFHVLFAEYAKYLKVSHLIPVGHFRPITLQPVADIKQYLQQHQQEILSSVLGGRGTLSLR